MKPQAAAFLEKARAFLDKAQGLLDAHHWPDEAGRAAYLAGLHAAQALIFENTGKVIKRHSGVQREFARLVKDEPRFDVELRAFLPRTYNLKAIADYVTGAGSQVSEESAREAIQTARRFVECITTLIPPNNHE
jgi:uncharacterized protein (UPF0332 family)